MTTALASDNALPSTVVLVDDEPMVLRGFERILTGRPYAVAAYRTAHEAIERVARGGVEVVVSDVSMPEISGIDLLRTIRTHDADLPVVLVTGIPGVDNAAEAIEYGAFRYLVKPVEPEELRSTIDRAIQLYRLARMKREALALSGSPAGASDRAGLETSFERALEGLWMAFQPIIRPLDRSVFGYEALLRSEEPALPTPGHVLDAAERLDQLPRLGRIVRDRVAEACRHASDVTLFVNLHPQDLGDPHLLDPGSALGGIATRVVLEITERSSLGDGNEVTSAVRRLRDLGFRIAIDDLGAGYAGLSSFALLEPDVAKLDMTLVRDIDTSAVKRKLVASMTALCKDMGMLIVAEGVETAAERDVLVEIGCDLLQGYLFARPGRPFPEVAWS